MTNTKTDIRYRVVNKASLPDLDLFDESSITALTGIRVFDVGQGDCIGLLNQDSEVFCYVDFGGLNDHPDKKVREPSASRKRLRSKLKGKNVSIILTHWDKDHYWSAYSKNPDAKGCRWIVPRQHVSPQAALFASQLKNASRWPEVIKDEPVEVDVGDNHAIHVKKVSPFDSNSINSNRNNSGLVVTITEYREQNPESYMLMPGDCPYHLINLNSNMSISGLVAYHHGASSHSIPETYSSISNIAADSLMVFSHGENHYGHPVEGPYKPEWYKRSISTMDIRAIGGEYIDLLWR